MPGTYDILSAEHFAAPYETYALMREKDPLYWHEEMQTWFATRYADVYTITRDRRASSQRVDSFVPAGTDERTQFVRQFFSDWMLYSDPPEHTRLRKLVSHAFVPRSIAKLESFAHSVVQETLDRLDGKDQIDIISEFGFPVPSRVIGHMLGVAAEDIDDFEQWSHDVLRLMSLVGDPDENVAITYQAMRNLEAYFRELIAERRRVRTDDLLGLMVQADDEGTELTDNELIAHCALLLIAGHETTTHFIGNATLALLRNPGELAKLRADPGLATVALEELVRYDGVVAGIARQATEDMQLSAGVIPAGDVVIGVLPSANHDPAVFHDPDRLDLNRGDTRHLGFGGGVHSCIGNALGRMESIIALNALLARYPRMELAVSEPDRIASWAIRGVSSLPVNVGLHPG